MKTSKVVYVVVLALCVATVLLLLMRHRAGLNPVGTSEGPVQSGPSDEIMMMRTKGGLLEVSAFRASEVFDRTVTYWLKGVSIPIGKTVAHVRVTAYYRYNIELEPEWPIHRRDNQFEVIAPPVKPSLPVAVDLKTLEGDVGGTWILLAFNSDSDLKALQSRISEKLERKAGTAEYIRRQRDDARLTLCEFVNKWLVTQTRWKNESNRTISVRFKDDPDTFVSAACPRS